MQNTSNYSANVSEIKVLIYGDMAQSLSQNSQVQLREREGERRDATENAALSCLPRCRGDTDYHSVGPRTLPAPGPKLSYYFLDPLKTLFILLFTLTLPFLLLDKYIKTFSNHSIQTLERNRSRCQPASCARQRGVAPVSLRCLRAPVAPDVLLPWRGEVDASLGRSNNSAPS